MSKAPIPKRTQHAVARRGATTAKPKPKTRRSPASPQPPVQSTNAFSPQRLLVVLMGTVVLVAIVLVVAQSAPRWLGGLAQSTPGLQATATPDPANRIGIVSGHRGNDSGTICKDGLTEAQVNFDHATRVASFLRAEGYEVDILDEFDARLKGYRALALLSIHADSCTYINDLATGFKVARALESRVPEVEDALVACLSSRYKRATGLRFHANTVTRDMTEYHAFGEIDPQTPAAIIETGFMSLDRVIVTRRPQQVAQGITDGVLCFLRKEQP